MVLKAVQDLEDNQDHLRNSHAYDLCWQNCPEMVSLYWLREIRYSSNHRASRLLCKKHLAKICRSEAFSFVMAPTKNWALERESPIVSLSSAQGILLRQASKTGFKGTNEKLSFLAMSLLSLKKSLKQRYG